MPDASEVSRRSRRALQVTGRMASDLAGWHGGRLSSSDTHIAVRRLHRLTGGRSSRVLLAALKAVPGSMDRRSAVGSLDGQWSAGLEALRSDGIARVPDVLDERAVERIRDFASTAPARLHLLGGARARGSYVQRTETTVAVHVVEDFVLDNPDVQTLICHPAILEAARRYFGIGAIVHPPLLYWTCRTATLDGADDARPARRFHWDYDGLRGLRVHVNLTDVDEASAPMQYLTGTHRTGSLRTRALRSGDSGIDERHVRAVFGDRPVRTLGGPAGATYVSDSQGLHRGTDPVERDRLFLVMPLQASGFAGYQLRPRPVQARDPSMAAGLARSRPELRMFTERRRAEGVGV